MRINYTLFILPVLTFFACDPAVPVSRGQADLAVQAGSSDSGELRMECPEPEKCITKACFDPRSQDKIDCAECGDDGCYVDGNFDALCLCESVTPDEGMIPCMLCSKNLGLYLCQPPG